MKRKIILLGLIVVLLSQGLCLNAQAKVSYYVDGNDYLKYSETTRTFYVIGLIDMWLYLSPEDIDDKTDGMTGRQLRAIFEKYLQENPAKLHYAASYLFVSAILDAISKLK